jgi:hypothetical protein
MSKAYFTVNVNKILNKQMSKYTYIAGVSTQKNRRRKVLHNKTSLYQTTRGLTNKKATKRDNQSNVAILERLYKDNFPLYEIAFSNINPNYKTFKESIKYLFNENPRRFENAISANIKACLDKQNFRKNKKSTVKFKGFNRFGVDSRQLQMSFDAKRI